MFVGGGKLTYYLCNQLADTKIKIKIIEQDEARCRQLSELLPNAMIIHGDGSDQQVLLEEGILQTEAFASLTGFDEENIMLSLYAASKSNAKLITKVNRIAFESVINWKPDPAENAYCRPDPSVCKSNAEFYGKQCRNSL